MGWEGGEEDWKAWKGQGTGQEDEDRRAGRKEGRKDGRTEVMEVAEKSARSLL